MSVTTWSDVKPSNKVLKFDIQAMSFTLTAKRSLMSLTAWSHMNLSHNLLKADVTPGSGSPEKKRCRS